jgi:hypothetical protein
MGGKGELVKYSRMFEPGPVSDAKKAQLKKDICDIIERATGSITVEALVEPTPHHLQEELDKTKGKKHGGG